MKNLLFFLLGFFLLFAPGLSFAENNNYDYLCQTNLNLCQDSCKARGGIYQFLCISEKVSVGPKYYKCRCIDEI